jgi:hypothetical protein
LQGRLRAIFWGARSGAEQLPPFPAATHQVRPFWSVYKLALLQHTSCCWFGVSCTVISIALVCGLQHICSGLVHSLFLVCLAGGLTPSSLLCFQHMQCKAHGINAPKGAEFSIVDALKEGSQVGFVSAYGSATEVLMSQIAFKKPTPDDAGWLASSHRCQQQLQLLSSLRSCVSRCCAYHPCRLVV